MVLHCAQLRYHTKVRSFRVVCPCCDVCKKASFYLFWIASHRRALPSEVIKMLIDSLVLFVLLVRYQCGVLCCLSFSLLCLQHLHNWGVHITASLRKYDHVSYHCHQLNWPWLSLPSLIKYRSLCVMHKIYYGTSVLLNPPIMI